MARTKVLIGFMIVLTVCILISCSTLILGRGVPEWIWTAPKDSTKVLYAVGGPSATLEEARGSAMKTISSYINTEVISYYGSYSSAYFDDIKRTIEEKNSSWVSSKSSSIVLGLQEIERWFDKDESRWWVLLRLEKDDFEKSIKATADEVIRKREQIEKNSNLAIPIIERLLLDFSEYDYQKRLYSALECYQTILSFEFAEQLTGKINGSLRLLLSFVENLINETIASTRLAITSGPVLIYRNTNNNISGTIITENDVDLGNLIWNAKGMDDSILMSFKPNSKGEFNVSIPGNALSMLDTNITIAPELSMFGKSLIDKFNMKIFTIPVGVYQGKYGILVIADDFELRDYVKNTFQSIVHDQLGFNCIEQENIFPMLKFIISQKVTDQNQSLAAVQTLITVECQYEDGTKRMFQAPLGKGFGATSIEAKEESFNNSVELLRSSRSFLQFLETSL